MLTWQAPPEWRGRKNFEPFVPLEESRQHYANVRIQELQRMWARVNHTLPFEDLLHAFRYYGMVYDQGYRLRNELEQSA